ncbi:Bis(5'-adenosyl)-triphosphatase enpp4 [Mizuhopecten yessoensis]|uniref:Bis(5'-adenosyl)-triphosphatase enpp4 n=2 Tax=Mizuhopecten yessoensis TaxID=6573 RepID=A0A210QNA8_MIZYE|nr:Bis(5'-adenosyl)-triphosphatase enpp4 [Mizuhopecten yessoensis]
MDGFRHDYLDQTALNKSDISNFQHFIDHGVKTSHIRNIFPSNTFPNHMTILTGQYAEEHGVVDNVFFDPYLNDTFNMYNFYQNFQSKWFDNGAEPIWVTNQKGGRGRNSGSILWPGGVAPVKCIEPRIIPRATLFNLSDTISLQYRIDVLIDWFTDTNFNAINFGMLYFEEPDLSGHKYGPLSKEVREQIKLLDQALGYLREKLNKTGLSEKMNIILTSDHGMNQFEDRVVDLDTILDRSWYTTHSQYKSSIDLMVLPRKGHETHVSAALFGEDGKVKDHEGFYAWWRNGTEMKNRYFSKNRRIMEIILEAKKGWVIGNNATKANKGNHGYNPQTVSDVWPFFIAAGPAFQKGITAPAFDMVDIYPLMCHILGLTPAQNRGNLDNVKGLLKNPPVWYKTLETTAVTFIVVVILAALVGGIFGIAAVCQSRISRRKLLFQNRRRLDLSPIRSLPETDSMLRSDGDEDFDGF